MQSSFQSLKLHVKPILLLLVCFLAVRAAFMEFMPFVFSKDVHAWVRVMQVLDEGKNPYAETGVLNWPPFWMQMIYVMHKLSGILHLWPERVIQLVLVCGEAVVMLIVYFLLHNYFKAKRIIPLLLISFAFNPILLFLTCQHGNFDIFVGMWILLFVASMMQYFQTGQSEYWLMACFCLGLGILTKTIPVILSPILLAGIRKQSLANRVFGLLLLFVPVIIGMGIIYTLAPEGVTNNVLHYRSMPGWYGVTGILVNLEAGKMEEAYRALSPFLFMAIMLYVGWRSYRLQHYNPEHFIATVLIILLTIPTFGPGYTPPYILWYFGLLVILYSFTDRFLRNYLILGLAILILTYSTEYAFFLSHGSFATSINTTPSVYQFCEWIGSRKMQVWVRIPMFLFYIGLILQLAIRLRNNQYITLHTQT